MNNDNENIGNVDDDESRSSRFQSDRRSSSLSTDIETDLSSPPIHTNRRSQPRRLSIVSSLEGDTYTPPFVPFPLCRDSYSMMILSPPCISQSWWFGIALFVIQSIILCFMISTRANGEENNFPFYVPVTVTAAQLIAIIITLPMATTDLIDSIKSIYILLINLDSAPYNKDQIMNEFLHQPLDQRGEQVDGSWQTRQIDRIYSHMVLFPQMLKSTFILFLCIYYNAAKTLWEFIEKQL